MKRISDPNRQLAYLAYLNRENDFQHHGYNEEMKQYALMREGDPAAVEEGQRMMRKTLPVNLSTDPLRNAQYLFVAAITIATRFAIEGGLDAETAYNTSDMYIRKLDQCMDVEDVMDLHREMFTFFTEEMAGLKKEKAYSLAISQSIEYIEANLHMPLRIEEAAEQVHLTPGYFSTLFKKETGSTFSNYVMARRIAAAQNMLRYSEYSAADISEILAFSSQSYFIRCFRKATGLTPREYRQRYFYKGIEAAGWET